MYDFTECAYLWVMVYSAPLQVIQHSQTLYLKHIQCFFIIGNHKYGKTILDIKSYKCANVCTPYLLRFTPHIAFTNFFTEYRNVLSVAPSSLKIVKITRSL